MAKSKMKPADAIKVLANEVNQIKSIVQQMTQDLMQTRAFLQEVARVLESYIVYDGKQEAFTAYMTELGEKAKEAQKNDNRSNGTTDGSDTSEDKIDKGVRTKGIRA